MKSVCIWREIGRKGGYRENSEGYPQEKEDSTMIYKDFQDIKLSSLGLGAMRLPVIDGDDSRIDEEASMEW